MTYKSAIIGCGNIAGGYQKNSRGVLNSIGHVSTHAGAYIIHPKVDLTCITDPDKEALSSFSKNWSVASSYISYIDMLDSNNIDILSITLPTEFHFEVFEYAIAKKIKAIWLEKPLSYDLEQAKKMAALAENSIVSLNYYRRWNSTLKRIKDKLQKGVYGSVSTVTVRYTKGLYCNASHLIDLMCWYFGEPTAVKVIESKGVMDGDPCIDFNLYYEDFYITFIHVPNVKYVFIDVDIIANDGRVLIEQRGQQIKEYEAVDEPNYAGVQILSQPESQESAWRDYAYNALDEIVQTLEGKATISCTVNDGLIVMELCEELSSMVCD